MSRTEHLIGKLKKVEIKTNLEETCKEIISKPLPIEYTSYEEYLRDDSYKDYYFIGNDLYKVEMSELSADENYFLIKKDGDDFSFELRYYNGSIGFNEAIEIALNNMPKVDKSSNIDTFKENLLEIAKSSNSSLNCRL